MTESFEERVARELNERADALAVDPGSANSVGAATPSAGGRRAPGRQRLAVAAAFVLFVGALGATLVLTDSDDDAGLEVRESPDVSAAPDATTTTTTTEPSSTTTVAPPADVDSEVAPFDPERGYPIPGTDLYSLDLPMVVSPSEGLVDGQQVFFEAKGLTPFASVGVVQCLQHTPPRGQEDCDLATVVFAEPDERGVMAGVFTVNRFINTASGTIDCAATTPEAPCGLGMGNTENLEESGNAPVSFEGGVEGELPPRIAVAVTTGLRHGDALGVVGTGFVPSEEVWLLECAVPDGGGEASCFSSGARVASVLVDETGGFSTTIPAFRILGSADQAVDCAAMSGQCIVAVQSRRSPNTVRLDYDPDGPLPAERLAWLQLVGDPIEDELPAAHGREAVIHLVGFGEGPIVVELVDHINRRSDENFATGTLVSGAARVLMVLPTESLAEGAMCGEVNPSCSLVVRGPGLGERQFHIPYPYVPGPGEESTLGEVVPFVPATPTTTLEPVED
jgi:hypothetical protein